MFGDDGGISDTQTDPSWRAEGLRRTILRLQGNLNAIENCRKPVLAAIHNTCIGGGIDMTCCCDMRYASEAPNLDFLNEVFADKEALLQGVTTIAAKIAKKSPLAARGSREMLLYSRDHSVAEGLNYIATWNSGMLSQADIGAALAA
ncbi:MAG: enoyl-CoA hydratase, partial [Halioglobus sp.]